MTIKDDVQQQVVRDLQGRIEGLTARANRAERELTNATKELDNLKLVEGAAKDRLHIPRWISPKRPKAAGHDAIICGMLSDTHYSEVVDPDEMDGFNAYDSAIAEARLERFFKRSIMLSRDFFAGVKYQGAVLLSGGDLLSGFIHDLAQTNDKYQLEAAIAWAAHIAAGIGMWADEYGKVHVPWTVGNHGRLTVKERTKGRVRDNLDWLIGNLVAREFKNDDRVTFQMPESFDIPFAVYSTRYLLYHGQTGGGGGIAGIWPPIMRLRLKKLQSYVFDVLAIGHFHQYIPGFDQGLLVNGSSKGYDDFAKSQAFRPERPQQALWLTTPEHGVTLSAPVIVGDRSKEGW